MDSKKFCDQFQAEVLRSLGMELDETFYPAAEQYGVMLEQAGDQDTALKGLKLVSWGALGEAMRNTIPRLKAGARTPRVYGSDLWSAALYSHIPDDPEEICSSIAKRIEEGLLDVELPGALATLILRKEPGESG